MMRWALPLLCGALLVTSASAQTAGQRVAYPATRTVEQVDTYHGTQVRDPYRWLENDVRRDPEVAAWVEAQNTVTRTYLDALPGRAAIADRLRELWNYDRYGVPDVRGERLFFMAQTGLENQPSLYTQEGVNGAPRLLINPNTWAADGATALSSFEPSPDGSLVAYSVQDGGTDWRIIRVLDVATGETRTDEVRWAKFTGITWHPDGQSFYYARYPEPPEGQMYTARNFNHAIYRHRLGTPQSEDQLVYARPQSPSDNVGADITDDGRWMVITVSQGTDERYEIVLIDLNAETPTPRVLIPGFTHDFSLVGMDVRNRLLFRTNRNAPRGRIIAVDPARPEESAWREVVPQGEHVLIGADRIGNRLIATYLVDARSAVRRFSLEGRPQGEIELAGIGSVGGFSGSARSQATFYSFTSFNRPPTIYRYDIRTGRSTVFRAPQTPFDPNNYVVSQVFYTSRDGTRVPMFIAHRRDVTPNGQRPTLLYGYGGFNAAQTPTFQVQRLQWMEMGGVFVLANIRGGSEYGAEWHDGGRLLNKQNVYDDFIAAGEALIATGWTSPAHLAVQGRSNGGLLVGAVVNQRPDLFAAALPMVGVMDMLRYNQFSAGRFWTDDYGDPADPAHFRNLYGYSPYHNVRDGVAYPAILITTADTDDRVVPGHSFKYAARIQAAQGGGFAAGERPRLIRIATRSGHGTGRPTDQLIDEAADQWAFIAFHTGLEVRVPTATPR